MGLLVLYVYPRVVGLERSIHNIVLKNQYESGINQIGEIPHSENNNLPLAIVGLQYL